MKEIKFAYILYCNDVDGYWSKQHKSFVGEMFATKYKDHSSYNKDLEEAVNFANGAFVEIKSVYYI